MSEKSLKVKAASDTFFCQEKRGVKCQTPPFFKCGSVTELAACVLFESGESTVAHSSSHWQWRR